MATSKARISAVQKSIAKKLISFSGEATGEELKSTYIQIEPLIRLKYVRVRNENGTPVYVLTVDGEAWAKNLG